MNTPTAARYPTTTARRTGMAGGYHSQDTYSQHHPQHHPQQDNASQDYYYARDRGHYDEDDESDMW